MIDESLTIYDVCDIASTNRLFVNGWCMRSELARPQTHVAAALFMDGDKPVGVGIVTSGMDMQVFVRAAYRRKGIGSTLVDHLRQKVPAHLQGRIDAGKGVEGSGEFWKVNKVRRWDV